MNKFISGIDKIIIYVLLCVYSIFTLGYALKVLEAMKKEVS